MRALLLLPLLLLLAACDAGDDGLTLDAAFYAGTWRLTSVADGSGDRSADVDAAVDALTVAFTSGGAFTMDVDFSAVLNKGGLPDNTFAGDFLAQAAARTLVLSPDGLTDIAFRASATADDRVTLNVPAAILQVLLTGTGLTFTGDVTLTLDRV